MTAFVGYPAAKALEAACSPYSDGCGWLGVRCFEDCDNSHRNFVWLLENVSVAVTFANFASEAVSMPEACVLHGKGTQWYSRNCSELHRPICEHGTDQDATPAAAEVDHRLSILYILYTNTNT